jgi:Pentapeptide repeats (9 copies)
VANVQEIGPGLNRFVTVSTSVSGLVGAVLGALIAGLVAFVGQQINKNYNRVQSEKLRQDADLEREKHNLELYQGLGNVNARAQFAAAAVLLQRLESLSGDQGIGDHSDAQADKDTITHVLISILKEQMDEPNSTVLRKHIADNMVKALKLVKLNRHPDEELFPSILSNFDLQRCRLSDVFWRGVNLRKVDLYGSDLTRASLRNADLRDAVLYQSKLVESKFNNSKLQRANLQGAQINGADFSGADLREANLQDCVIKRVDFSHALLSQLNLEHARFDDQTKWPVGFNPIDLGALLTADSETDDGK